MKTAWTLVLVPSQRERGIGIRVRVYGGHCQLQNQKTVKMGGTNDSCSSADLSRGETGCDDDASDMGAHQSADREEGSKEERKNDACAAC